MNKRWLFVTALFFLGIASCMATAAQNLEENAGQDVTIKKVPIRNVNPSSGKAMYDAYCASCHGTDGTGHGPAAPALKISPSNLTLLAAKNKGRFPDAAIQQAIKGDPAMPSAHGSKEMPVWGPVFTNLGNHSEAEAQLRIRNLTQYLLSLQRK
jgi:mono/diheme cytochrome c family protein